ncbi:MAG: tetratricopeptide repeat protein [Selenomonadaceae bacterium]|nr:tetratricopeptide repeat protein [Selenomonadaceae bacterium]
MSQNKTKDGRVPLPAGAVIVGAGGERYTLQEAVGGGGSALIYRATKSNSRRLFVVKECYPVANLYKFVRENYVVCPEESGNELAIERLEFYKSNMALENEVGQTIAASTKRIVASWEDLNAREIIVDETHYDATGSFFIVMECMSREKENGWFLSDLLEECAHPASKNYPLRTGGLPAPYVVVCIMEEVLKSLRDVHRAGYIHGDIQDANFFLMGNDLKTGDIGVGMLLDFGNARKLLEDGKTAEFADREIFATLGYCAPEIIYDNDGTLRLTPAADIFSAGCLFLYLLRGMDYRDNWGGDLINLLGNGRIFSVKNALKRGYGRDAAFLLEEILETALSLEPEKRYQNGGEMLEKILELKKLSMPLRFKLAANLSRSPYWVARSRDEELARLQKQLAEGQQPLYIWGIGGVGKTELAMEFARKQSVRAYLVTFRGTMRETVLQLDFANYKFRYNGTGDRQEQEYCERLAILKTDYADCLLIVDNFDSETEDISRLQQEPAFKDIVGIGMHVLFTTRSRPDEITPELVAFSEKSAFELFTQIVYDDSGGGKKISIDAEEEQIIRKLLSEIEYHPLTVELAAKAVCDSWNTVTPRDLLNRFRHEIIRQDNRTEKVYDQIKLLFRVYSFDETYRQILAHMTLLPEEGMDAALILSSEDGAKKNQLRRIERRGFVRRRKEDNRLLIHSLIRSVIKNELRPVEEDCDEFLSALWRYFEEQYPPDIPHHRQAAELYENATNNLPDAQGIYAARAGYCFLVSGKNIDGLLNMNMALKRREDTPEDYELARMHSDAGFAELRLYDTDKAMKHFKRALEILEKVAPESPDIAGVLMNISSVYMQLGNFSAAIEYSSDAMKFFEKVPPRNSAELSKAHNALGTALNSGGRPLEAVEHLKTALNLMEKFNAVDEQDLAAVYSNLALAYANSGNFADAMEYMKKSKEIYQKNDDARNVAASFGLLSEICELAGQKVESDFYADETTKLLEKNYMELHVKLLEATLRQIEGEKKSIARGLSDPIYLVGAYCKAANSLRVLRDYKNAEKYIELAIETLGSKHDAPDYEWLNYANASTIYFDQGDFETALKYSQKAMEVVEKFIADDFSILSTVYMDMGTVLIKLGRKDEAMEYYQKSIEAESQCENPDHDSIGMLRSYIDTFNEELNLQQ